MTTLGKIASVSLSVWMAFSGVVPVQGIVCVDSSLSSPVTLQVQTRIGEWVCLHWPQTPGCKRR